MYALAFIDALFEAHEVSDWINLTAIKLLIHHTSAVIVAVVMFWLVGFVVQRLLPEGLIRHCVLLLDEFVLLCLFIYFAYELLTYL
ncbi:MAG TPA: hypothetical protein VMD75_16445 [Candidatus Binataceae bacterium]|nr:hypothetical protein [Candidatus Binataceae bacterium]